MAASLETETAIGGVDKKETVKFEILSEPSKRIKTYQRTIFVDSTAYEIVLITMKRTFLLAINNVSSSPTTFTGAPKIAGASEVTEENCDKNLEMPKEKLITCFMNSHENLKGLSLAIKGHSSCLIESANSVASCTLATRLSKKFNADGPVYVVNNIQMPQDSLEPIDFMTKFHMKVFQFVAKHYKLVDTDHSDR